jgi:hypothetical protein
MADPDWEYFEYSYFEESPFVQWKLLNLKNEAAKLKELFGTDNRAKVPKV